MNPPTQATPEIRPNSGETPIQTTGPKHVRFDHADGGIISFPSESSIACLFALGAMFKTRHYDPGKLTHVTPTDVEGRKLLITWANQALDSLQGSIGVIGKLMVYSADEMSPIEISETGWLLNGLADIAGQLRREIREVEYERGVFDETP